MDQMHQALPVAREEPLRLAVEQTEQMQALAALAVIPLTVAMRVLEEVATQVEVEVETHPVASIAAVGTEEMEAPSGMDHLLPLILIAELGVLFGITELPIPTLIIQNTQIMLQVHLS
jgi:hypothetical protein